MFIRRISSSNLNSYAILAITVFLTQFSYSSSKPGLSDEEINNAIRNAVNDGFTIAKEDKEYFNEIIAKTESSDDFDGDLRIVAGQDAQLRELGYQCALQFKNTEFSYCGAALIDPLGTRKPEYVITAAHCVKDRTPDTIQAVCGALKMSEVTESNKFAIDRIMRHPYDSTTKIGDLAILKLKVDSKHMAVHRSDHSNGLDPINIPDMNVFKKFSGHNCIVSGWGRQASGGATKPDTLQKAEVLVPTQEKCKEMYKDVTDKFKEDSMMCAGGSDRDACQGDSGGPLMCNVAGKQYLAGLVSWGIGCATEGVPGGYTNVANYFKWIKKTVTDSADENK